MISRDYTPLALFEEFRPRFREITWCPRGLALGASYLPPCSGMSSTLSGSDFYLEPMHIGQKKPIDHVMNDMPRLNTRKAGLKFSVDFDAAGCFADQFNRVLWQAIQEGLFKGRHFFMDPVFEPGRSSTSISAYTGTHVRITVEGGKIPGFHPAPNLLAYHDGWRVYVPPSPERDAIEAALALEHARREHASSEAFQRVGTLEGSLMERLAAVA